jgi:hypothetical protein
MLLRLTRTFRIKAALDSPRLIEALAEYCWDDLQSDVVPLRGMEDVSAA